MNDFTDKLNGITRLPIFPLPMILFPHAPMPLHIFEPRYQKMLADIQLSNNLFGLSYYNLAESDSDIPDVGHIGCVAEVNNAQNLPDGRSNILTIGIVRYHLEEYIETDEPYLVGEVSFFEDFEEDEEFLKPKAANVLEMFKRIATALQKLNDNRVQLPDFPEVDPQTISFLVASAIDFDNDLKYELFATRSTSERLDRLQDILVQAVSQMEERANIHKISKTNGHSKKKIEIPGIDE